MTKTLSMLKPLLIASYILVFIAALGAFSSTMGCVMEKAFPKAVKKTTTHRAQLPLVNPMQVISAKF